MKPVRVPDLRAMKAKGTKITVLTAYDAGMARLLVGDSVGMVVLGHDTTLPVNACVRSEHASSLRITGSSEG